MITVTKKEHDEMVASAEATLMVKAWAANCGMQKGCDADEYGKDLSVALCNLESIERYETGEFQPEEYFNVLSPLQVSGNYSNVNNI